MKSRAFASLRHLQRLTPSTTARFPCTIGTINSPRVLPSVARSYASISAEKVLFGQPVHETHPHLLKAGEITPGISAQEYSDRRARLAKSLPDGGIAILSAADVKYRSGSVFYEFHQDSDFFYLTGFNEPEAVAVIEKAGSDGEYVFHLFVRPKDASAEQWEGTRSGEQAAIDVFNADESGDVNKVNALLYPLIKGAREIYTDISNNAPISALSRILGERQNNRGFQKMIEGSKVKPLRHVMNNLRMFKSEAEIRNMRFAGQVSGRALTECMRYQFDKEKDLQNHLDFKTKAGGCDGPAYFPVVAGGRNALGIHYVRNDDVIRDGEMVLVDAGGEYGGYITDITRTWPINGKFTAAQKDLYNAVLNVQRKCMTLCTESAGKSLDQIHEFAESGLKEELRALGFDVSGNNIRELFPHHVGHYVGLDVHDCPGYPRNDKLRAGQCVTIEPGIYVPNDKRWPAHFRNMGIRIEDSVCVQGDTYLNFTAEAVKEVVDIENLDRSGRFM